MKSWESGWSLTLQAFWASFKKVPIKPEVSVWNKHKFLVNLYIQRSLVIKGNKFMTFPSQYTGFKCPIVFHTVKASVYKFTYPQCERGSKSSVYNFTAYPLKKVCSTPYPGSSSYMLDSTLHLLHLYPEDTFLGNLCNCIIHWIEIYSVNDLIHHLNKWGPVLPPSTLCKVKTRKK